MKKNFGSKIVKTAIVTAMTIMMVVNPMMPVIAQGEITLEEGLTNVDLHFNAVKDAYDVIDEYDADENGNEDEDTLVEALEAIGTEDDKIQEVAYAASGDSSVDGTLGSLQEDIKQNIGAVDKAGVQAENDKADNIDTAFSEDNYEGLADLVENVENNKDTLESTYEVVSSEYAAAEKMLTYYDAIREVFGYPGVGESKPAEGEELDIPDNIISEFPGTDNVSLGYAIYESDIAAYTELIENIDLEAIKGQISDEDYETISLFKEKYETLVGHYNVLASQSVLEGAAENRAEQENVTALYEEFNALITDTEGAFNNLAESMKAEIEEKNSAAKDFAVAADEETKALLDKVEEIKKNTEADLETMKNTVANEDTKVSEQAEAVKEAMEEVLDAKADVDEALVAMEEAIDAESTRAEIKAVKKAAEEAVQKAVEAEVKADEALENAKKELADLLSAYEAYEIYTAGMNTDEADVVKAAALANIEKAAAEVEKATVVKNAAKEGTEMATVIAAVATNIETAKIAVDNATSSYEAAKKELAKLEAQLEAEKNSVELKNKIKAAEEKVASAEANLKIAQTAKDNADATYKVVVAKAEAYFDKINAVDNNRNSGNESEVVNTTTAKVNKPSYEVVQLTSLSGLGIILDEATPLASGVEGALVAPEKAYILDCTNKQYNVSATVIDELKFAGYTQIIAIHHNGIASVYDLDEIEGGIYVKLEPTKVTSVGQGFKALKLASGNTYAALSHIMLEAEVVYVFNYDKVAGTYVNAGAATTVEGVSAMITGNNTLLLY